jgi:uncharacterized membrane protein
MLNSSLRFIRKRTLPIYLAMSNYDEHHKNISRKFWTVVIVLGVSGILIYALLTEPTVRYNEERELRAIGRSSRENFEVFVLLSILGVLALIVTIYFLIKQIKIRDFTTESTALKKIKQAKELREMGVFSEEEYNDVLNRYKKYLK